MHGVTLLQAIIGQADALFSVAEQSFDLEGALATR
jgi:hypothetical protein